MHLPALRPRSTPVSGPARTPHGLVALHAGGAIDLHAALGSVSVRSGGREFGTEGSPQSQREAGSAGVHPVDLLAAVLADRSLPGDAWRGYLAYGLGGLIEPSAGGGASPEPVAELHRTGPASPRIEPRGLGLSRCTIASEQGREAYTRSVERTLEYIRAGDIYQANIAHRLSGAFSGCPLTLYAGLASRARPLHGMYFETPTRAGRRRAVLSLSPELFMRFDARTRRLVTRPMKGTRPGDGDPDELRDAEKDRAELAMIVDLMRNDMGRVCEFGSVLVEQPRAIERHASGAGAVLQATATVSGTLREGLGAIDVLRAAFPPGSVTGAPKIRAMQVIEELEPFARGPYCGCIGSFMDDGSFELAVAIRTIVIEGPADPETGIFENAELSYCVGAGIVADSDPESEWRETIAKARVLEPDISIRF